MKNVTKMKVDQSAKDLFEAFVDPTKIGHFWFSSSSERWEDGKTVTLRYDEYNAEVDIKVKEIENNQRIVYEWGGRTVTITFEEADRLSTIVAVEEDGFDEESDNLIAELIDNKEGWVYMLSCLKGYMEYGANLRAALVK
ncbi:SRPBCC family protein [Guptibacillus algicola]|uniref:SRPBCC family protein n=1 Tax=Guptibacillus algicola TaxID=225844 RepID=UPI001CD4B10D|nr:SRPBCC family protein [Alkalihalobacillus algicola]MCA0987385.1 SRPBCC family protein [Alkalihalobacillus algicola]